MRRFARSRPDAASDLIQVNEYRCAALKKDGSPTKGSDMKTSDVMVSNVTTVGPDACVQVESRRADEIPARNSWRT
jgi:hypothetical protein